MTMTRSEFFEAMAGLAVSLFSIKKKSNPHIIDVQDIREIDNKSGRTECTAYQETIQESYGRMRKNFLKKSTFEIAHERNRRVWMG